MALLRHGKTPSSCKQRSGLAPCDSLSCTLSFKCCHSLAAGRYLKLAGPWCLGQPPRFWQRAAAARPTCAEGACCGGNSIAGSFYTVTVSHRGTNRPSSCCSRCRVGLRIAPVPMLQYDVDEASVMKQPTRS